MTASHSLTDQHLATIESFLKQHQYQHLFDHHSLAQRWLELVTPVRFNKADIINAAGSPASVFGLIHSGLVRYYYLTPEGKEWNKAFYQQGHTVIAASAYLTNTPATFTIAALEDSELLCMAPDQLALLTRDFPEITELVNQLIIGAFIRNEQREAMLLTRNAEQRYHWLQTEEPALIGRIPQFHLASYLGIDAVSLSRIKRKLNPAP